MDILLMLRGFVSCSLACAFFAVMFRAPKKTVPVSAVTGGIGYVVYLVVIQYLGLTAGFFFGTLAMSVLSEIFARIFKMPVTVFEMPAIVSLVPGAGIYSSMLYFVNNDNQSGIAKTVETLMCAGAMALAIASTSMVFRLMTSAADKKRSEPK